jgi:hypothetical protein
MAGVRFPVGARFFFSTASRLALVPTKPPIQLVLGPLPLELKQQRREGDHSPLSSAEVRNGGAITPLPNTSFLA